MEKIILAIYARKSGNSPTDTSIQSQIEGGEKYANDNGYEFIEYVDEKISGRKGLDTFDIQGSQFDKLEYYERPEFARMIQDIKKEKVKAVWTYNQDRIERNTNIWIMFSSLIIQKEVKYIVNNTLVDLNDAMTKMVSTIFSVFNEYYSMTTSLRVRPAHQKNALGGKTHGAVAYGYMRDTETGKYTQNPEEAKVVKDIFSYNKNNSMGAYLIADKLNSDGIPCSYAKRKGKFKDKKNIYQKNRLKENTKWSGSTISGILKNTIYKGYKFHGDVKIVIENPIIDEVLWNSVNKGIEKNKNGGKRPKHKYLLAEILFCGHCENLMIGKHRNNGTDNAYKCSTKQIDTKICKKSRGLSIPKLETFIIKHLFENAALKDLLLSVPQDNKQIKKIETEINYRKQELSKLEIAKSNLHQIINSDTPIEDSAELIKMFNQNARSIETKKGDIKALESKYDLLDKKKRKVKIKNTIEGMVRDYPFELVQKSIRDLIENIKLMYVDLAGNRDYYLFIKYKGTSTITMFKTDTKAMSFECVAIQKHQQTQTLINDDLKELFNQNPLGKNIIEKYDGSISDTYLSVGKELFTIQLNRENLVTYN